MKRYVLLFLGFILHFALIAQDTATDDPTKKSYYSTANWSDESKLILLWVFIITCLVFAARTFRNKPEA